MPPDDLLNGVVIAKLLTNPLDRPWIENTYKECSRCKKKISYQVIEIGVCKYKIGQCSYCETIHWRAN